MSEQDETVQDAGDGGAGEAGRIASLDSLGERLDALAHRVEQLFAGGGGRSPGPAAPAGGGGVRSTAAWEAEERRKEIRAEVSALRQQEAAEAERASVAARLGKLEKAAERPPRELRRVERIMGWGR